MRRAIYAGTFDPITLGHLDVIERSSKIVDELVVGVLNNFQKNPLFTAEEREDMIRHEVAKFSNIKVASFSGLLIDFARSQEASFVIRGLRAITDFDYELQMAQTNKIVDGSIDTIFLTTSLQYAYLSSSTVKEVAYFGGDISRFVPERVAAFVREKFKKTQNK